VSQEELRLLFFLIGGSVWNFITKRNTLAPRRSGRPLAALALTRRPLKIVSAALHAWPYCKPHQVSKVKSL